MLFVRFQLGKDHYAVAARDLIEVLPAVILKGLPGAPAGTAGLMNYRGHPLPVIDLSLMVHNQPATRHLSTRILVVRAHDQGINEFGLLVEQATEVFSTDPEQFCASGMTLESASYLGPVACTDGCLIQWIRPEQLLTPALLQALKAGGNAAGTVGLVTGAGRADMNVPLTPGTQTEAPPDAPWSG
jgi:chemotaxis-related protein WspB